MVKKRSDVTRRHVQLLVIGVLVLSIGLALSVGQNPPPDTQFAVGVEADLQCLGGADAKCQCGQGLMNGRCDPRVKGGGKIGCPCTDVTAGKTTSGRCIEVGRCKGEQTDGKMPELPKLPEMPKQQKQEPQASQPSSLSTGCETRAQGAGTSSSPAGGGGCTTGITSTLSGWLFGGSNTVPQESTATEPSPWERLLQTLHLQTDAPGGSRVATQATMYASTSQSDPLTFFATPGLTQSDTVRLETARDESPPIPQPHENARTDSSENRDQSSTFSFSSNSSFSSPNNALDQAASTLRRMLDMIRGWIQ